MDQKLRVFCLSMLAASLMPAFALAQQPPDSKSQTAQPTEQRDAKACSKQRTTVGSAGDLKIEQQPSSLSDHLASTDGVICPPARIDPDISVRTPDGGAMRVIRPDDDPNVRPK